MHLGGDAVGIALHQHREDVRLPNHLQHPCVRPIATAEHEAEGSIRVFFPVEPQLRERLDHILTVTRNNNEGALSDALHHVLWLHRRNGDATDDCVHVATWPERLTLQAIFNDCQRRVRKNLAIRKHTKERNPVALKSLLKEAR